MRYTKLGSTCTMVPVIGQGTMGIEVPIQDSRESEKDAVARLRAGFDLGMTLVDTAENYGMGRAEIFVGKASRGIREKVCIATKVSPEHLTHDSLIRACEGSLHRLNSDYIDLYQIHWPNPSVPLQETMEAMRTLKEQGKIRAIGVSNFSVRQIQEAKAALDGEELTSSQVEYNLFDRGIEQDLLPYCQSNGMTVMAYSPLDQGVVAQRRLKVLTEISEKCQVPPAKIVLNWLVSHRNVVAIPKARKIEHIRENAAAADFQLDPEDMATIESAFRTLPIEVPTNRIKVVLDGVGNRRAYQTLEQALENSLGFTPSPLELAEDMRGKDDVLKPVRVRPSTDPSGKYDYDLVEGRIRYWAWVIAHDGGRPMRVLVRE